MASSEGAQRFPPQNRLPNKINIIPDAPLFGHTIASPMLKPQVQPNFPQNVAVQQPQGEYVQSPGLKMNNPNNFKPYGMINQNVNNGNNYFNAPLFNQNMQFNQGQRPFGGEQDNSQNNDVAIPPGLLNNFNFDHQTYSGSQSPFYQNQQNPNFEMNYPAQHKMSNDNMGYGGFPDRPQTPDTLPDSENNTPNNRGRIKGPVASLRTEVLMNNVRRDSSASNSPSLNKIQRDYFSGVSTPRSDTDPHPIGGNAPMSRFPNFDTNNDGPEENSATLPLTEDMIENFKLEDYKGRLVEFAKSYHGSRILQKFFPKANQQEIDFVIYEIQDKMEELMLDSYANYMFQTLAQSCSSEQRYYLLQKVFFSYSEIIKTLLNSLHHQ